MARYGDLGTQYFDDAGDPLVNGKVFFYETGTTTLKTTYADVDFAISNTNPVILTAAGRQPNIFFDGVAKAILATSAGTQILVRDPVGDTAESFGNPWIASKRYSANDVVQGSDGQYYVSLINGNVNNNPVTTTGNWTFLYSVEWNAGTTYKEGSVITYQTLLYQSLQSTNLNRNPVTETTYWVIINLAYVSTVTYTVGQNVVGPDGVFYTALRTTIGDTPASSASDWVGTSAAAAASATAAAASATSAAASETNAATSETNAATSASTATTQASNASTSASNAATSESNASTSESNASISATSALGYLNTFKGQYYGSLASDPTVDPLGDPLTTGDLYWNSVGSEMRTYSGSAWVATYLPAAAYATLTGTETLTNKTLTAPVMTAPALGTPASGTLTNATGLPAAGVVGTAAILGANTFTGVQTMTSPVLTTPNLGTPSSGTLSSCTVDGTDGVGFKNIPQNSKSAAYTLVLSDAGKHIYHPATDANARTFTIPANASVAYPVGTAITFINMTTQVVTIAITTDTMYLSSAGTTGSRSLALYGSATAIKMTTTTWLISGSGLT